jgi:hypothetical protein
VPINSGLPSDARTRRRNRSVARSEQLLICLKQAGLLGQEAAGARSNLLQILERLAFVKGQRDRLLDACRIAA